jgi:hypothetical protein
MGLFTPAWQKTNEAKALAAIENITDEQLLANIVKLAPLASVRLEACARIRDPDILLDAIKSTGDISLWRRYVPLLDENRQRDFYQYCTHADSIATLIEPEDESLIYGFAMFQIMKNSALLALSHLSNDRLKADVLLARKPPLLKEYEISDYIHDPKELIRFVNVNINQWEISPLLSAIHEERDLAQVVKYAKSGANRDAALDRIEDLTVIEELVFSAEVNYRLKAELLKKANDQHLIARALRRYPDNDAITALLRDKEVILALLTDKTIPQKHLKYVNIDMKEVLGKSELVDYHRQALHLMGGFVCVQCGHIQLPQETDPCCCRQCGAINHDYQFRSTVEERGRHESGREWKECIRCHDVIESKTVYRDTDY